MDDLISRRQALKEMWKALYEYEDKTEKQFQESKNLDVRDWIMNDCLWVQNGHNLCVNVLANLPSAQPEWNNHTVACLLADVFGDTCACNYNDIDEWLPEKCELLDSCPHPDGVACWEQFLKHKAERRTDE